MSKNIFKNIIVILPLFFAGISAQDQVDAIEAARQAKAAAEKAAADAEAATGAAIEAAAAKAAKEAREKIKQDKLDEEARKAAEKKAAEEAELDAAASAAAEEAKRKMAEELGLEYEAPSRSEDVVQEGIETKNVSVSEKEETEEIISKEPIGYSLGATGSVGFINGAYITNTPVGGSIVLKTPFGFSIGNGIELKVSLASGSYNGEGNGETLETIFIGAGFNATVYKFVFSETHIGLIGPGLGVRSFSGVSLERILNKGLNLPVNILVGLEGFLATEADGKVGNSTYWGGLGIRLDYSF